MLRIQSLAKITFEIDENFTPVLQSLPSRKDPKTSVTSLDKRDRQSLFPEWILKSTRDLADHVSLSSLFNCQKTDGQFRLNLVRRSKNILNQIRLYSHQLHQETLERVRRPPEAPPLSFDGRVIGPHSQAVNRRFHKNRENRQVTEFPSVFRTGNGGKRPSVPETCDSAVQNLVQVVKFLQPTV